MGQAAARRGAIGLMSGTSLDGIDAALIQTDGERIIARLESLTLPYDAALREALRACLGREAGGDPKRLARVEKAMTEAHAEAVSLLLQKSGREASSIEVIGFHGQTLFHAPAKGRPGVGQTHQIGDGALLARLTGCPVVTDFRQADVQAGGEGAPFAPLYHAALARDLDMAATGALAVLNIGGVANVSWIGKPDAPLNESGLLAFDTGPGNALIDDWVWRHNGQSCDRDGHLAAAGEIDRSRLDALLTHPYFTLQPPKSLDRDAFSLKAVDGLSLEAGAATLTAFTVESVALARSHFPAPVRCWLVCGGGRHNRTLMAALQQRLGQPVLAVESVGWDGDALEAQAFAFLALRSRLGLSLSLPGTTGVPGPLSGGVLHQP